jgi:hypothetical protein
MSKISYSGYRFPPEIIQHAIWLNECSASSRTGDASHPEMTAMRTTISLVSPSQP